MFVARHKARLPIRNQQLLRFAPNSQLSRFLPHGVGPPEHTNRIPEIALSMTGLVPKKKLIMVTRHRIPAGRKDDRVLIERAVEKAARSRFP